MFALFTEKPTEMEEDVPSVNISTLPQYDLPEKRQKTEIGSYDQQEIKRKPKQEKKKEISPSEWEKLPTKKQDALDDKTPILIGKGNKAGKVTS